MISTRNAEFDFYCAKVERRLPDWSGRMLRWLRLPSSRRARILVSALLVLGSLFSFLPVLGLWMLPLGLIIIAQDLPFLKAPLVSVFRRIEACWDRWQRWRKQHLRSISATAAERV
jgi:hypothetical protein